MTKLNGSEKQIAWAEDLRNTILNGVVCQGTIIDDSINQSIEKLNKSIEMYTNKEPAKTEEKQVRREEMIKKMVSQVELFNNLKLKIESETSAKWFIDNRTNNHSLFTKEVFSK